MKKIVFVCLGNICRSPMAEFVMKDMTSQFHIESRATSNWEYGNPIYPGTQKIFQKHKIPYDKTKTSQQISQADFEEFDVIIGMDSNNVRDLQKMAPAHAQNKIFQFAEKSVPDPWYTGDFDETYEMVKKGCQDWLDRLQSFDQE
ncbi:MULTISPECIES: low molecular weight protein-tyrosine-phosphatase [Streptococcus]|uniref:low molecular weight protein-tyrosine-phosphatase n=1 Tax=Streptococcus TaxID=1301 RepID=UPI0003F7FC1D|nr:low molecular weight protein-tyrosine-phosphatase [Streptococcus suis]HEM3170418.1 low molecular weight phosphotyrosine protein phosphatase [Streptococcus suis]HEM6582542.1 low molecular weight phosphotyrosine protein phosphatase [Streptococcus suis]